MTEVYTVEQCLDGEISVDETVTVRGWVKTRRDSKAGLSFISLHDGSWFGWQIGKLLPMLGACARRGVM